MKKANIVKTVVFQQLSHEMGFAWALSYKKEVYEHLLVDLLNCHPQKEDKHIHSFFCFVCLFWLFGINLKKVRTVKHRYR